MARKISFLSSGFPEPVFNPRILSDADNPVEQYRTRNFIQYHKRKIESIHNIAKDSHNLTEEDAKWSEFILAELALFTTATATQ